MRRGCNFITTIKTAAALVVAVFVFHVILLTARSTEEQLVEGLGTGADAYMTKPFRKYPTDIKC